MDAVEIALVERGCKTTRRELTKGSPIHKPASCWPARSTPAFTLPCNALAFASMLLRRFIAACCIGVTREPMLDREGRSERRRQREQRARTYLRAAHRGATVRSTAA